MNTDKRERPLRGAGMAVRLWAIMMVLVLLTVGFMWIFQVVLMARNYIESKINEVQAQLDPIMGDLETEDLAYNEQMLSDLSSTADGKMLIINDSGQLAEMYTFGHPIDLSANHSDVQVWERIANGENYPKILAGKPYTSERMDRSRVEAYEIGIPIRYHGEDAYLILYHSFEELYNVLDMNRRQLVILSVILTAAAAVLAAFLARRFTRPIRVIKRTVDRLAAGGWTEGMRSGSCPTRWRSWARPSSGWMCCARRSSPMSPTSCAPPWPSSAAMRRWSGTSPGKTTSSGMRIWT